MSMMSPVWTHPSTHALRRGLHSFAASRLGLWCGTRLRRSRAPDSRATLSHDGRRLNTQIDLLQTSTVGVSSSLENQNPRPCLAKVRRDEDGASSPGFPCEVPLVGDPSV